MSFAEDFRTIADAMPHLVWTAFPEGGVEYVNAGWMEYTGYGAAETRGNVDSVLHPDDVARMWAEWEAANREKRVFEIEYRLKRASDGVYRWFLARALPRYDKSGMLVRWIGTATDIDAQKRAGENMAFVMDASRIFAAAFDVEQICRDFAQLAIQRFADWCFVALKDAEGKLQLRALMHRDPDMVREVGRFAERYPAGEDSQFAAMLDAREPLLFQSVDDAMLVTAAKDEQHLTLLRSLGVKSAIVAPLIAAGNVIGGIVMYSAESKRLFENADLRVVRALSDRAAVAIENARLYAGEQRARRRLQFIGKAADAIYETLDLTASFGELTRLIVSELGDFAVAMRLEGESALRVIAAAHRDPDLDETARVLVGVRTLHTEAERQLVENLKRHRPFTREHIDADHLAQSLWPYVAREVRTLDPHAAIVVPLHSRGITYGAIIAYYSDSARRPTQDDQFVLEEVGRHASVAMENAQVFESERRMAQTLQDSLLPPSLPKLPGMGFDAVYLPSASVAQVGGDWYDAFQLEDGSVVISTGDVTGRGPNAAVIMGKVRHLLSIAPSYERDPARILDTVESVLARRYPDKIVTAFLAFIDPARAVMMFANAGHPMPLLRRAGGTEELRAEGLPIGLRRNVAPSESRTVDISDAKLLVLYTDGLVEAGHDVLDGFRRLHEVVNSDAVLHTHSPARFIEESCLGGAADDDVAILTVAFQPTRRWSFDAENAKAAQDARGEFVQFLREHDQDADTIAASELVFGELIGNVVRHAPGAIDIDLDWSNGFARLHVIDRGHAFMAERALPEDAMSESGRGLFIVRQLATELKIEHVPGYGNHVTAGLPLRHKFE